MDRNFIFDTSEGFGLGDTVVLAGVLRDLADQHPDVRFRVEGSYASFWDRLPFARRGFHPDERPRVVSPDYSYEIKRSNDGQGGRYHYLVGMRNVISALTGRAIRLSAPCGAISAPYGAAEGPAREIPAPDGAISAPSDELWRPDGANCGLNPKKLIVGPYWLLVAGGKADIPAKIWSESRYQKLADLLGDAGITVIQAGTAAKGEYHFPLEGVESAIGITRDIADFFRLVRDADGVICGVTGAMHIAAALHRPCVVLAGGREAKWWEAYTNEGQWPEDCPPVPVPHAYFGATGELDCCRTSGCWCPYTEEAQVPKERKTWSRQLCSSRVPEDGRHVPECLTRIEPEDVAKAVLAFDTPRHAEVISVAWAEGAAVKPNPFPKPLAVVAAPPVELARDKFTVFVLYYGDYYELAKKSIKALLSTTRPEDAEIRVAANQCGARTLEMLEMLRDAGRISAIYADSGDPRDPASRKKYPAMREMFYDPLRPIRTEYVVWLDDDVEIRDPDWIAKLRAAIAENRGGPGQLFGRPLWHEVGPATGSDLGWFREATWWADRHLPSGVRGEPAPNGNLIPFVAGYFWAAQTAMIHAADIPDVRLRHNGGDVTIGCQAHQLGFEVRPFNVDKEIAWCPTKEAGGRRGFWESFPSAITHSEGFVSNGTPDSAL